MADNYSLDIQAIMERLPHRYPFLLVDRVESVTPGESIVAIKNVSVNESHFTGHFPRKPVMPGVLITECLAQTAGLLAAETATANGEDEIRMLYLVGIDKARFKRMVTPGDRLVLEVSLLGRKRSLFRFDCTARVDGTLAAQAEILMSVGKET